MARPARRETRIRIAAADFNAVASLARSRSESKCVWSGCYLTIGGGGGGGSSTGGHDVTAIVLVLLSGRHSNTASAPFSSRLTTNVMVWPTTLAELATSHKTGKQAPFGTTSDVYDVQSLLLFAGSPT
jgi:hypothetical protein